MGEQMQLPLNDVWSDRHEDGPARSDASAGELPAARLALLAHLETSARAGAPRDAQRAREAMRALCDEAHRHHLRAEQLLHAIKGAWRSLPQVAGMSRTGGARDSLDSFISLCMEEFYARRD